MKRVNEIYLILFAIDLWPKQNLDIYENRQLEYLSQAPLYVCTLLVANTKCRENLYPTHLHSPTKKNSAEKFTHFKFPYLVKMLPSVFVCEFLPFSLLALLLWRKMEMISLTKGNFLNFFPFFFSKYISVNSRLALRCSFGTTKDLWGYLYACRNIFFPARTF